MPDPMPHDAAPPPFAALEPGAVLDALFAAGLDPDGRLLQLNSYENRVWQAHLDDGRVVVAKFYRPDRWSDAQIAEEHRFTHDLAGAELPVVAPLALAPRHAGLGLPVPDCPSLGLWRPDGGGPAFRLSVTERRVGRAPELESPHTLAWLGRLIGRLHAQGRRGRFLHRRPLDLAHLGQRPRAALLASGRVHPETEGAWIRASEAALQAVEARLAQVGPVATLRLHGDCHPGNVLWRDEGALAGPHFVDFDDCGMGPAVQDLWMLLPGEREAAAEAWGHLREGYEAFMPFDPREWGLVEALRTLRMVHHSAWIAARWSDPAFPVAFPWFGQAGYWAQQATELWEQVERLQQPDGLAAPSAADPQWDWE